MKIKIIVTGENAFEMRDFYKALKYYLKIKAISTGLKIYVEKK
jgi:hypothetical protein